VSSPFEAIQFLGIGTVRSLTLSAHIFSCFDRTLLKGFSIEQLWAHLFRTGTLAQKILLIEHKDPGEAEEAYTAGMLHDVGKLMLANSLPVQFQKALTYAANEHIPLHVAESEIFGASHAGAAAYLLGLWGLPASIVEAVAFHHTPRASDTHSIGPLAAVHVANFLEHESSAAEPAGNPAQLDAEYLAAGGLQDRIETWRAAAATLAGTMNEE
jgi:HD-like signal output (HDOD) protein